MLKVEIQGVRYKRLCVLGFRGVLVGIGQKAGTMI